MKDSFLLVLAIGLAIFGIATADSVLVFVGILLAWVWRFEEESSSR